MIMKVLINTHQVKQSKDGKIKFRCISTDSIEKDIVRSRDRTFRDDTPPRHLTERIRQAARRLVAIPGRSGTAWQAIALEPSKVDKDKWVQRGFAPDRGEIILGLATADACLRDMNVSTYARVEKDMKQEKENHTMVDERALKDVPEWEGRYWMDESGKVRPASDKSRPWYERMSKDQLDGKWEGRQQSSVGRSKVKRNGWREIIRQNKATVDKLSAQRNKEFGL
jgi:hypothetical protein